MLYEELGDLRALCCVSLNVLGFHRPQFMYANMQQDDKRYNK